MFHSGNHDVTFSIAKVCALGPRMLCHLVLQVSINTPLSNLGLESILSSNGNTVAMYV